MLQPDNYDGALQRPLSSGFDAATTAATVMQGVDLSGKTGCYPA
ncbi:hypothetical protein [Chitinophaga parva]|nr:hypothetical protein [Chitinophaga parva]